MNYSIVTSCEISTITGSEGTSTSGSGGGGGTSPTIPPGYNPCPGPNAASIKGEKRVNLMQGCPTANPDQPSNPDNPVNPPYITNNIINQCLRNMVNQAINRNIKFNVSQSMNGIFNSNANFNINFIDGLMDSSTSAETTPTYIGRSIVPGTTRLFVTELNIEIKINTRLSATASQEYIAATILHEALHAYFRAIGTIDDHNEMVTKYIPWFISVLHTTYPNVSDDELLGLAFAGLTETTALKISQYANRRSYFDSVNSQYKFGGKGTPCN